VHKKKKKLKRDEVFIIPKQVTNIYQAKTNIHQAKPITVKLSQK